MLVDQRKISAQADKGTSRVLPSDAPSQDTAGSSIRDDSSLADFNALRTFGRIRQAFSPPPFFLCNPEFRQSMASYSGKA